MTTETLDQVFADDPAAVEHELFDVATACLFGIASQRQKGSQG